MKKRSKINWKSKSVQNVDCLLHIKVARERDTHTSHNAQHQSKALAFVCFVATHGGEKVFENSNSSSSQEE